MKLQESLEEWEEFEIREIRLFVSWWNSMHDIDAENYPIELDEGEFDKQYSIWQSM